MIILPEFVLTQGNGKPTYIFKLYKGLTHYNYICKYFQMNGEWKCWGHKQTSRITLYTLKNGYNEGKPLQILTHEEVFATLL